MAKYTDEEKMNIASEIIKQMGGHKMVVMTGARNILATDSGVQFSFPGCKKANKIVIDYTDMDLYTMKFYKVGRLNKKTFDIPVIKVSEHENLYHDMLKEVFEKETGLYTSL